eukprot:357081-Chlamydomonas_euryale.AAC.1
MDTASLPPASLPSAPKRQPASSDVHSVATSTCCESEQARHQRIGRACNPRAQGRRICQVSTHRVHASHERMESACQIRAHRVCMQATSSWKAHVRYADMGVACTNVYMEDACKAPEHRENAWHACTDMASYWTCAPLRCKASHEWILTG